MTRPRLGPALVLLAPLLVLALAGCLGGDDVQASGEMRLVLTTAYDASLRPATDNQTTAAANAAVDLPAGAPAVRQVFQIVVRPVIGEEYVGWEGDEECVPGYVNHATKFRRPTDCSATDDKAEIVVPPPRLDGNATRLNYRLDENGSRVLVFPREVLVAFRILFIYSDELLAQRADPTGCDELGSFARGQHERVTGNLRVVDLYVHVQGDGTVHMPFYGFCRTMD